MRSDLHGDISINIYVVPHLSTCTVYKRCCTIYQLINGVPIYKRCSTIYQHIFVPFINGAALIINICFMKTCHQIQRKEPDSPESRHESIRKKARDNTMMSATKMANYYNKTKAAKSKDFQVGNKVSFCVPKIDRCSTNLQRIPGEIVSVPGGEKIKLYKVATSVGLVKNAFSGGDLDAYSGTVHVNTDKVVSIRQAALEIKSANRFTVNRCKCKGQCSNAQCSCIRSGIFCSNHCHPGRVCKNREKQLYLSDKNIEIAKNGWLTDDHLLLVNSILKREYPEADGLQDTVLQQNCSWKVPVSEFVQFLHVEGNHWTTISNIGEKENCVNLYDSLYCGVSQTRKELIANYINQDRVKINVINVQQQENNSDCGVFAIAYVQSLLEGNNPAEYDLFHPRKHLANYLPTETLPKFPKVLAEHTPVVLH